MIIEHRVVITDVYGRVLARACLSKTAEVFEMYESQAHYIHFEVLFEGEKRWYKQTELTELR